MNKINSSWKILNEFYFNERKEKLTGKLHCSSFLEQFHFFLNKNK